MSVLIFLLIKTLFLLVEGPIFMTLISLKSLLQILSRTSWLSSAISYCKVSHTLFPLCTWIIPPRPSHLGLNVTSSKTCSLPTHRLCTPFFYSMAFHPSSLHPVLLLHGTHHTLQEVICPLVICLPSPSHPCLGHLWSKEGTRDLFYFFFFITLHGAWYTVAATSGIDEWKTWGHAGCFYHFLYPGETVMFV